MIFGIFVLTKEQNIQMENKLNELAINDYIERFSSEALNQLFDNKEEITGEDILSFPLQQVGLFCLKEIFLTWKSEAEKLESSYFNYSNGDVQDALTKLLNALSNNIQINRNDFKPIFIEATRQSIMLSFSPYKFYSDLIGSIGTADDMAPSLKNYLKFIKVNPSVLVSLIEKVDNGEEVSQTVVDELLSQQGASPEGVDQFFAQYSEIVPLSVEAIYVEHAGTVQSQEQEEELVVEKPSPKVVDAPASDEDDLVDNTYFVSGDIETINERFSSEPKETIADTLAKESRGNMKSMLSINQKFMFINDLFDGNQDDFIKVIDFLDDCENETAALAFVQNNYIKRSLWREEAPPVKEFIRLISVRFA